MNNSIRMAFAGTLLFGCAAMGLAEEGAESEKKSVWSTLEMQLYGYVKLDAAYDSAEANVGNFVRWIEFHPHHSHDDQFSMTANETRLGLRVRGPEEKEEGFRSGARVEIDFYGGGAENKPRPMLRHAYLELVWPESGWQFLAGQTGDVISPLVPRTINYPVAWWAGNIGYRRPQIRGSKTFDLSGSADMVLTAALTRDIGSTDSNFVAADAGADAGIPGFQGRLGWILGKGGGRPVSFGFSGHWAKEELDTDSAGNSEEFDSWSANLDIRAPLGRRVTLQAEAFTGENLAVYLGGIGQGVNLDLMQEIGSSGGWVAFDVATSGPMSYHFGASLDDPDDEDLNVGDRSKNSSAFINGRYQLGKHVTFGLELSYWETDYKELASADSIRGHFAVYYSF